MEEEEDDDIYAAEKATVSTGNRTSASDPVKIEGMARGEEDEEEGEELEEDESDSVSPVMIPFPIATSNTSHAGHRHNH